MIIAAYRASRREVVREVANSPNIIDMKEGCHPADATFFS
jgi:hypothetical protein